MTSFKQYILAFLAAALLVSGCAPLTSHNPLPQGFDELALIPGLPENARFWGDRTPPWIDAWNSQPGEFFRSEYSGVMGQEHNYLAISGGGANGAFGAGLLKGWTAAGNRPDFTIVTGISTGALIAPFAFLGSDYDSQVEEIYTTYSTRDLIRRRSLWTAVAGDAVAATDSLKSLIGKYVDQDVIETIAAEGRKGRRLFIGTTDLEADRPVIWNITRIAASDAPGKAELIHKVLLASASIPAAFPPVIIEVASSGQRYDELHVDGGTSNQVFLYPVGLRWEQITDRLQVKGTPKVYLIRNAQLHPVRTPISPHTIAIASRAIASLIRTQGIGDMYRVYFGAIQDGLDYRLAYIPETFTEVPEEMFDPVYMRKLFDLGYRMAEPGFPWHTAPPGFKQPASTW